MTQLSRQYIQLNFSGNNPLRAEDIPYDGSNSIKDKLDALGGGGDPTYVPVTTGGTPALAQALTSPSQTATHTYTLSDWSGTGYDPTKVRMVHVLCTISYSSVSGTGISNVQAKYPDGTTNTIAQVELTGSSNAFTAPQSVMVTVPVNAGATTFELRLNTGSASTATSAAFTIIGVTQY